MYFLIGFVFVLGASLLINAYTTKSALAIAANTSVSLRQSLALTATKLVFMTLAGVATGLLIRFGIVSIDGNRAFLWLFLAILGLVFLYLYWLAVRAISGQSVSFVAMLKGLLTEMVIISAAIVGLFYILQAMNVIVQLIPA